MLELSKGLLFGLLLSFLIGPVFFALIQTSLERGLKAGVLMAIGISCSDILYILITYIGISYLSQNIQIRFLLGILGAVIMFVFGVHSILKPIPLKGLKIIQTRSNNFLRKIAKGFILNAINPFLLIFWLGIAGYVTIELRYRIIQVTLFYAGIIIMVLLTDIMKAYLANKLRDITTPRLMKILNRTVGVIFILLSIRLFYYAVEMNQFI